MKEYIYLLKPSRLGMLTKGPTEHENMIVGEHIAYLEGLNKKGVVVLAGRSQTADEESFGIVILRAENDEAANGLMQNDPAVMNGVMTAKLYPYRIAIM